MSVEAPLFVDAFALCEWLLLRLGSDERVLARALCSTALRLLEELTLALKNRDRDAHVEGADERLITLRVQVRLAGTTGHLNEAQVLHALARADDIGRQLGGWRRKLGPL